MNAKVLTLLLTLFISQTIFAQKDDPVLFTVDHTPVPVSEFKYIYNKTNGQMASYSEASLNEYLGLYKNFKLKVHKAREMQLDTITSLRQELAGYRRQLADSYLIDREVTEKLVKEAYDRSQQNVEISHILFRVLETATPADTLMAWNRALEAKSKLEKGELWASTATEYSDDTSVKTNRGHVGFVAALFPNGFYDLETAAYNGTVGEITGPIRSSAGYHLLKVHGRRSARGEMEVAHVLIRNEKAPDLIKARWMIDTIYNELQAGANFEELAKTKSHDKMTASKGGYIGYFGINRYEKSFEDAAFALEHDGDYTKPVKTSIGWHLIKRISRKANQRFQMVKSRLENQVKQDQRFELARKAMIERIINENNFSENRTTLDAYITSLEQDSAKSFLTYKWKAPEVLSQDPLCSLGDESSAILGDFQNFLQRSSRKRQQLAHFGIAEVAHTLYGDFVAEHAMKYEERHLEVKYPGFKSLMREYEEGVLLFEVTKKEVWDKASQDTTGLQAFYEEHKGNFQWKKRAVLSQYSLAATSKDQSNDLREFAKTNPPEAVLDKFNQPDGQKIITYQRKVYEEGRNEVLNKMPWEVGALSPVEVSKRDGSYNFFKIEETLPPGQKTLKESRGYVVADYQDYLEKKWLEELKKEYKVKVSDKVFKRIVKKN
jgi:peptidyl-prolyl cis-trans isomerase SurA